MIKFLAKEEMFLIWDRIHKCNELQIHPTFPEFEYCAYKRYAYTFTGEIFLFGEDHRIIKWGFLPEYVLKTENRGIIKDKTFEELKEFKFYGNVKMSYHFVSPHELPARYSQKTLGTVTEDQDITNIMAKHYVIMEEEFQQAIVDKYHNGYNFDKQRIFIKDVQDDGDSYDLMYGPVCLGRIIKTLTQKYDLIVATIEFRPAE